MRCSKWLWRQWQRHKWTAIDCSRVFCGRVRSC
jgi:hypothetical protein